MGQELWLGTINTVYIPLPLSLSNENSSGFFFFPNNILATAPHVSSVLSGQRIFKILHCFGVAKRSL